jgi:hypothetical protein
MRLFLVLLALALTGPVAAQDRGTPGLAEAVEDPRTLLRLAEGMVAARRVAEATDLLERAEARLLTRAELASEADRPTAGGAIGELAAARDALARRDLAGAGSLIAAALRRLDAGEPAGIATGPGPAPAPAAGGGGPVKAAPPAAPGPLPAAKPAPLR